MAIKLEENGTWTANISYYKNGEPMHTHKRGFKTKREAQRYELDFRDGLKNPVNIKFEEALTSYLNGKNQ